MKKKIKNKIFLFCSNEKRKKNLQNDRTKKLLTDHHYDNHWKTKKKKANYITTVYYYKNIPIWHTDRKNKKQIFIVAEKNKKIKI